MKWTDYNERDDYAAWGCFFLAALGLLVALQLWLPRGF